MTHEPRQGAGRAGLLSRVRARLARTEPELEARDLQEDTGRLGGTPIIDLVDRSQATVFGAVRSVRLRARVNVPALVVEIYDGSKTLNLIWLGQGRIRGVVPGIFLSAQARVTFQQGIPTIFNPCYEIRPGRGQ